MKIINVAGARPNFMKIAPLMEAFAATEGIEPMLVHTGQHYDEKMSDLFFRQLDIPEPDVNLGVGSSSHAVQTAEIMKAFEPVLLEHKPDAVLVVGDVNSTIACGLVAKKLGVKLIHVEAGLRSFDRSMPEEINRLLTDSVSDLLLCTEQSGVDNLLKEGIPAERIFLVGNLMIDTLLANLQKARQSVITEALGLEGEPFAVLTLHRPGNVDNRAELTNILSALETIQNHLPVVFCVHPRTMNNLEEFNLAGKVRQMKNLKITAPLGYLDFLKLLSGAKLVLTDSGGIQEETTILKVPCLTLRNNTERPVTVETGCNRIVGTDPAAICDHFQQILNNGSAPITTPPLWDGHAAKRITDILLQHLP